MPGRKLQTPGAKYQGPSAKYQGPSAKGISAAGAVMGVLEVLLLKVWRLEVWCLSFSTL